MKLHIKNQMGIIIALFICLISTYAEAKTDLEKDGYKGNVQKVICYEGNPSSGELKKGRVEFYNIYNKNGYVTEKFPNMSGLTSYYKYDTKNQKIEECSYDSAGSLTWKDIYKYDANNKKIEECGYNSDGSLRFRYAYKYDTNNNLIEDCKYTSDGKLYKYTYKYDTTNNLIEECSYDSAGRLTWKTTYKYDTNNNLIEGCSYRSAGILDIKSTCKYDTTNNLINVSYFEGEGEILKRGKIIEYIYW